MYRQWQQRQPCSVTDFVRSDSYQGMGWSQAMWAWRPLFRVRVVFFATFPERSRSRPRQTTGPFRKELKNTTIDPPEVLVHCKLTQVHMPRGSTIGSDTVFGVICQLPLLREEFRIATLTFHSDLRRRAVSRRALPCPSSLNRVSTRL